MGLWHTCIIYTLAIVSLINRVVKVYAEDQMKQWKYENVKVKKIIVLLYKITIAL